MAETHRPKPPVFMWRTGTPCGLKTELPDKWEYYLDRLSCHIASTGKQYHSHAATIYKWAQEDAAKGKAAPKQGIPDYSCKEGESL